MYELVQLAGSSFVAVPAQQPWKQGSRPTPHWPSGGAASPAADPQATPAINSPNEESKDAQDASTGSAASPAQANSATAASAPGNNANAWTPQANNGAQNGAATSAAASPSSWEESNSCRSSQAPEFPKKPMKWGKIPSDRVVKRIV
ncbi:hypothetical protein DTO021D3_8325 [Paecilomyces variotii]|nr:hypothetical protein DTO032I3_8346 [Paecilomyces variotii]KAJ9274819.1 hypothetical protein DTO021D3_8325 [Paecilomyces variotii]KAJ9283908.1 hypothetical protein DTO021C3_8517 [Paecilomyces variotii]KAJ9338658.1 hypothetical protein DTO027B6_8803 [Paecilomyces variotii]